MRVNWPTPIEHSDTRARTLNHKVLGPTDPPSIGAARAAVVRDEVKRAADTVGVPFIDPLALGWLTDPALYGTDQLHPNYNGHTAYANLLRTELEKLNIPRLNACDAI